VERPPERPMRLPYASELKRAPRKKPQGCIPQLWQLFRLVDPTIMMKEFAWTILDFLGWWFGAMRFARGIEKDMQQRFEELSRAHLTVTDEERKKKIKAKLQALDGKLSTVKSSNPKTAGIHQKPTYFKKVKRPKQRRNRPALGPDVPHERPVLKLNVIGARGLTRSDFTIGSGFLPPDPYFTCTLLGARKTISCIEDVVHKTTEPVWNSFFEFPQYNPGDALEFNIYDRDIGKDDLLGKASLEPNEFFPDGFFGEIRIKSVGLVKDLDQFLALKVDVIFPKAKGWGGDPMRKRDQPLGWHAGSFEEDDDDEEPVCQTPPFFVIFQVLFATMVWAFNQSGEVAPMAGLEALHPGKTSMTMQRDCTEDYRLEPWRWVSYQYTHVGFNHVFMNCLMLIIMGTPLEGFNGTFWTALMFNIGVFGGACCWMVTDIHTETVGMSGGCYSLIGITLGSLWLNKDENKYFKTAVCMCLLIPAVDLVQAHFSQHENVSNAAHGGGTVAGFLASLVFGRNLDVTKTERRMTIAAFVIGISLAVGCVLWAELHKVPETIFEQVGYCWWRQIIAPKLFGDSNPRCVRCSDTTCISAWEAVVGGADCKVGLCIMGTVSQSMCKTLGGWSDVEPK